MTTTQTAPGHSVLQETRSRHIILEAPHGDEHGEVRFIWALDDGAPAEEATYSYWLWPDSRIRGARRSASGPRHWTPKTLPAGIVPVSEELWAAWTAEGPEPAGSIRRYRSIERSLSITGRDPFTTARGETIEPARARIHWVCLEGGDRSGDLCNVDLYPEGPASFFSGVFWSDGAAVNVGMETEMPAWLRELAEAAREDLTGTAANPDATGGALIR